MIPYIIYHIPYIQLVHLGHNNLPLSQLILLRLSLSDTSVTSSRTCRSSGSAAGLHVGVSERAEVTSI